MVNKAGALFLFATLSIGVFRWTAANADAVNDQKLVQELDSRYQTAVEKNDAATMDRLLADNFLLVTGTGMRYTKADLLNAARNGQTKYEQQSDSEQSVRVWGDSDTYARKSGRWQYVFGQAAQPLKATAN
jgi:hypothetical protein